MSDNVPQIAKQLTPASETIYTGHEANVPKIFNVIENRITVK